MTNLRRILQQHGDGSGLSRHSDDQVIAKVAHLINSGRLRICSKVNKADGATKAEGYHATPERMAEDRVIRSLTAKTEDFSFAGSVLRIIRANQWLDIREDQRYQIVPRDDARNIIEKMAAEPALSITEKKALQEASSLIPDLSRNRRIDNGILLLRSVPVRYRSASKGEPAVTPSQIAKSREKELHWIEIELVDEVGVGIPNEAYCIVTPDKQEFTGVTDADGWARLDRIVEGKCKISFPNLDKNEWQAV